MVTDYNQIYNHYLSVFNKHLESVYSNLSKSAPKTITDAMKYAVEGGGKRVRPVLCLATADILSVPFEKVLNFAVAIETIHSYSLVHDDLPAMDNDDYRRGKLSTHKKFGEANGILAGDALLTFAFELCLNKENFDAYDAKALSILAKFAGYSGMVAGQVLDLENERNDLADQSVLYDIYENKTAKLIMVPLLIASIFADGRNFESLTEYGYNLGVLFQIVDDIMDVECQFDSIGKTPNKDEKVNKLTSVKLWGVDGAKKRAEEHYQKCKNALKNIEGAEFLSSFADAMYVRRK